jgi:prolyl 4-hydroxylase
MLALPTVVPEPDHPDRERLRRMGEKVRRRLAADKTVTRIPAEHAELWAVSRFFSPGECDRLIAMIDAVAVPSTTYDTAREKGLRTSYSGTLDPTGSFVRSLRRRIDKLLGLDGAHGEMLQGQRYTSGQHFGPHIDWFQSISKGWAHEKDNGGQRAFTAMVYLNDVYDGGETDFPRLDLAIAPRAGTLLAWNNADPDGVPNPYVIHAGNPVGSGLKYVVTRWYRVAPASRPVEIPRPQR